MKLWNSFKKELMLAYRGFYFYIEIFMAVLLLVVLLFVVPENFDSKQTEYLYLNLPEQVKEAYLDGIKNNDLDGKVENVEIKAGGNDISAKAYITEGKEIYVTDSRKDLKTLADKKRNIGAIVKTDDNNNLSYEYYLQGYEAERLKNLYLIAHIKDMQTLKANIEKQDVRALSKDYEVLTDRENIIPVFLTFNGSLMGLFIIAAYIFLDKQEGVIKAYAVTASSVWQYLLSKVGVLLFTSIVSSLIVLVPIMGFKPNYLLLLIFLLTTGFFSSSLGLLTASFYNNFIQAFGVIYLFMMAMIVPSIGYFIPSWNPVWIRVLPTYPMLQGFKEIILKKPDATYVLIASLIFLAVGVLLFAISNKRYKKTLTV